MRFRILAVIGLVFVGPLAVRAVQAEGPVEPVSLVSTNNLMIEMNELRAELDELKAYGLGGGKDVSHCCDCCYPCGWFVGVEAAIVKPHFGNGVISIEGQPIAPDFDYHATPRINLGFRGARGLGIRARYWVFDQASNDFEAFDPDQGIAFLGVDLDVRALDLEVTKAFYKCGVHWDLGAGVRYGKVEVDQAAEFFPVEEEGRSSGAVQNLDFEGGGPTFSLEGRHRIGSTNFAVIGNLRASLLYGEQRLKVERFSFDVDEIVHYESLSGGYDDKVVPVIESQIGIEWGVPLWCGRLSARAMVEGQWWGSVMPLTFPAASDGPIEQAIPANIEDLGFFGGTVGLAYEW